MIFRRVCNIRSRRAREEESLFGSAHLSFHLLCHMLLLQLFHLEIATRQCFVSRPPRFLLFDRPGDFTRRAFELTRIRASFSCAVYVGVSQSFHHAVRRWQISATQERPASSAYFASLAAPYATCSAFFGVGLNTSTWQRATLSRDTMWLQARRCLLREMQAERKGGGGGGECAGCSSHDNFHAMVAIGCNWLQLVAVVGHDSSILEFSILLSHSATVAADGYAAPPPETVEELPVA